MSSQATDDLSWSESRKLIVSGLERMEKEIAALGDKLDTLRDQDRDNRERMRKEYDEKISDVKIQIAMLQVKIGVGAAILSVATSVLVSWLSRGH